MKKMNKVLSLALVIVMILSLATTAFAANEAYQYEIYQIFTGEYEDDVLTNIKWGKNGTGSQNADVDNDTLAGLEAIASESDNDAKLNVILQSADLTGEAFKTVNTNDATVTVEDVADGYYLVKDVANSQEGEGQAYTTYVVKVVDNTLSFTRKTDVPTVDKEIVGGDKTEESQVSIGDTVSYKFTGTAPSNIGDYATYFYKFTDTLDAGLDYVGNIHVTVNGKDATNYFYVNTTIDAETGKTKLIVSIKDLLALELLKDADGNQTIGDITASTEVVVTYDAVVNQKAVVGTTANKNSVDLEYSNNPNDDGVGETTPPEPSAPTGPTDPTAPTDPSQPSEPTSEHPTGTTPKDEVFTYTTELNIIKVDENGNRLTGAEFTLTGTTVNKVVVKTETFTKDNENGTYYKLKDGSYTKTAPTEETQADYDGTDMYKMEVVTEVQSKAENVDVKAYVGEDGTLTFTGLGAGEYTITESDVPDGYNGVAPMKVTIAWAENTADAEDCTWTYTWENGGVGDGNTVTVVNEAGSNLPETGGMGTTLFYVFGTIMVLGAGVVLVTKKRMAR